MIKILKIDIETSPNLVYTWGTRKQFISAEQIVEPTRMLCFAAKWMHDKNKVVYRSEFHHGREEMLEKLWELLDEADAVVHYNGKRFDIPHINREFLEGGFTPPSPYKQIDLYQVVVRKFRFQHNRLDYILDRLGLQRKLGNEGFPLWVKCLAGDKAAWSKMKKYNVQDVRVMGPLYEYLLPWIDQHPNVGLHVDANDPTCPKCGSHHVQKRGTYDANTYKYQRYHCQDCGAWSRSRNRLAKPQEGLLR